jgi:hypothetical protein|uniref:Uncharacterized protein n=1 Tax=virus sp. ctmTa7 TaxID=2828255 RepID=A0A8S5RBK6_9VIRU|nr:MAG TPA: hypothetical protein [virus sp. ctmTa7]
MREKNKNILEAIDLLKSNGYFVIKKPKKICKTAERCSEFGCGECLDCNCFVCLLGNE